MELHRCAYDVVSGWRGLPPPAIDGERTLVLLFGAPELPLGDALAELRRVLPRAHLLGCSTAGEIHQERVRDDSISAAVIRFARTDLRLASAPVATDADSRAAGVAIADALAGPGLRGVVVLSEGLAVNGSELARGLGDRLDPGVIVTGGLAGDGGRFHRTWVLHRDRPTAAMVTAVGLYGDHVHLGHGSQGGWDIFGPDRVVTRSAGNVLYELDGKPALALYKEYLGDRAAGLPTTALLFPLAILRDAASHRVVRTVLGVDEATQSMRFAGDIPQGALAQLMRSNVDRLVTGAADAALAARPRSPGRPVLSLAVSCVGRRLVLKGRTEEELEAALDGLPAGSTQVGFYSYGELSPIASGRCELHNQTMTLTTIDEDGAA